MLTNPAISWLPDEDDHFFEAASDPTIKRAQRAVAAAREVLDDRYTLERTVVQQLLTRLKQLKTSLQARVMGEAGGVTDFRRLNVQALVSDVDRLILQATQSLQTAASQTLHQAADLGELHADAPMQAAQLTISPTLPGLDRQLVLSTFDNTADLLTTAMQAYRQDVVASIRRVALAGDSKMAEINRLRDRLAGDGFNGAAYKAERIVRTEVGRVFNMASFERLLGLAGSFPFLRKGWRATRDARTRLGHREASATYTRGQGIPISERFHVNVHNERPGKPPVQIGVARLRFPIDPQAEPGGRLAAASTILCRCGAFVDFDIAQFQQFATSKVTLSLTGVRGPAPEPTPVPVKPKRQPVVRQPKVPKTKPLGAVVPGQARGAAKPQGTPVSAAVAVNPNTKYNRVRKAYAILDSVHGDGELQAINVGPNTSKLQKGLHAYYQPGAQTSYTNMRRAGKKGLPVSDIGITDRGLSGHPLNTTFHESGHWLDHKALPDPKFGQEVVPRDAYASEHNDSAAWDAWRTAAKQSATIQRLERWRNAGFAPVPGVDPAKQTYPYGPHPTFGYQGDGVTPKGVHRPHLNYLLSAKETWARAYAQYIAVRSGDTAALAELRQLQTSSTYGPVRADQRFNTKTGGKAPDPDSWDYPVVWQDDEFAPIAQAIDQILEGKGWRTPGSK